MRLGLGGLLLLVALASFVGTILWFAIGRERGTAPGAAPPL